MSLGPAAQRHGVGVGRLKPAVFHEVLNDAFNPEANDSHGEGYIKNEGAVLARLVLTGKLPHDKYHVSHEGADA